MALPIKKKKVIKKKPKKSLGRKVGGGAKSAVQLRREKQKRALKGIF